MVETRESQIGTFGSILLWLASLVSSWNHEDEAETTHSMIGDGLAAAVQQLASAPKLERRFSDAKLQEANNETWKASERLTEGALGLSHSIVIGEESYSIVAFSRNGDLDLAAFDGEFRIVGEVTTIPATELTPDCLDDNLRNALNNATQSHPALQHEVLRQFNESTATVEERRDVITALQLATDVENRRRDALHFGANEGTSSNWEATNQASDHLRALLGLPETLVADGKAYHIQLLPDKKPDYVAIHLYDDHERRINTVRIPANASHNDLRQGLQNLTAPNEKWSSELQSQVLKRFDAAHPVLPAKNRSDAGVEQPVDRIPLNARSEALAAGNLARDMVCNVQEVAQEPLATVNTPSSPPSRDVQVT
jgi:hypothetical protein